MICPRLLNRKIREQEASCVREGRLQRQPGNSVPPFWCLRDQASEINTQRTGQIPTEAAGPAQRFQEQEPWRRGKPQGTLAPRGSDHGTRLDKAKRSPNHEAPNNGCRASQRADPPAGCPLPSWQAGQTQKLGQQHTWETQSQVPLKLNCWSTRKPAHPCWPWPDTEQGRPRGKWEQQPPPCQDSTEPKARCQRTYMANTSQA